MPTIVVLGAGVSGLTTALLLARRKEHAITVVAKHMPGDYDIEYASPWAGANSMPMASEENSSYERQTWHELKRLASEVPEAGIHLQNCRVLRRKKDLQAATASQVSDALFAENPWHARFFPDWTDVDPASLPPDCASASEWTSVCINTALYLPYLVGQCRVLGVVFRRANLGHVADAAHMSHTGRRADVVVNASGLSARKLGGVMDGKMAPVRGQIVVVRNELTPMLAVSGATEDGEAGICYAMTRASGGGTVLGGTYQLGSWESQPDANTAARIMQRLAEYHPQLRDTGFKVGDFDIVRHGVGLRPYREGGVRIEKELVGGKARDSLWVVHNYGHSGWGYQASYGCSARVLELVDEALKETDGRVKARI